MRVKRQSFGLLLIAAICLVVVSVAGCGGSSGVTDSDSRPSVPSDVVGLFGGEKLTLDAFEARYAKSVGGLEAAKGDSMPLYEDFLTRYVNFRLKVLDAKAAGIDHDSALVAELAGYETQLARPYLIDRNLVDKVVRDLFEKQQLEVTASHILVRPAGAGEPDDTLAAFDRIQLLRDSVLAGADFAEIAERHSDDQSAVRNRGFLGTFSGGRMIEEFENRAYSQDPGEISDVFRTRFGYHLLLVHERGPRTPDIRAAHILVRSTDPDTTEAFDKISDLLAQIEGGADLGALATEHSDDQGSAARAGDLGAFGRGKMVPEFDAVVFELENVGDVSGIVKTQFGYHIIQLTGKEELPTYDEQYDELKRLATRLPRYKRAEAELGQRYREELGARIDTTALDTLTASFPSDSVLFYLALEEWDESSLAVSVAALGPQSFTLGDLIAYGQANKSARPPAYDRAQLYLVTSDMLDAKALDVAASMLEETDPEFAALMAEYRDGIILFRVMEDSVWNKASTDTVGLQAHYDMNPEAYQYPERMRISSFYATNDSLLGIVAAGWTPNDTTSWADIFGPDDNFRLDTTYVADTTNSIYDRVLGLDVGGVAGPERYRRGSILLGVDGVEQPRMKTFDESIAQVLGEHQSKIEDAWIERLHDRYNANVYPENLSGVFEIPSSADVSDDESME